MSNQSSITVIVLCLLLFSELLTNTYYPNSNTLAGMWAMLAIVVLTYLNNVRGTILGGIFMAIAAWMRFDVLLIGLIVPVVLFWRDKKVFFSQCIYFVMSMGIVMALLFYSSGASFSVLFSQYRSHVNSNPAGEPTILGIGRFEVSAYLSFFGLSMGMLIIVGLAHLVKTKSYMLLTLIVAPIIPLFAIYFGTVSTPKYFFYLIPFFALAALTGAQVLEKKKYIITALLLLLLLQNFSFSLKSNLATADSGPLLALGSFLPPKKDQIEDYILPSADGYRLLSPQAALPAFWMLKKIEQSEKYAKISKLLDSAFQRSNEIIIFYDTRYSNAILFEHQLKGRGFIPNKTTQLTDADTLSKNNQMVVFKDYSLERTVDPRFADKFIIVLSETFYSQFDRKEYFEYGRKIFVPLPTTK